MSETPSFPLRSVSGVAPETVPEWPGMEYSESTDLGMRIERNVTVPMRDGKLLRVDLYRPEDVPMKRCATPEEIAPSVVYLASDAASFTTGAVLVTDGGYTLH